MIVKDATRKDYKIVNRMLTKLNNYHAIHAPEYCAHIDRYFTKKCFRALLNNTHKYFIAYIDDTPVGVVGVKISKQEKKQFVINELYVEDNYRKQGIGKTLLETAIKYAKRNIEEDKSFSKMVSIGVFDFNKDAWTLYKKMGFVPQSHNLSYKV